MANDSQIKIVFNADGTQAIQGIKQVQDSVSGLETSTKSSLSKMMTSWTDYYFAIKGGISVIKGVMAAMDEMIQFKGQKAALDGLLQDYGVTADGIINQIQRVTDGVVTNMEATQMAARALQLGLDPAQIIKFAEYAGKLSDVMGTDVSQAMERLTMGTISGSEKMLRGTGIIVDLQGEYKKYGDSVKRTVEELSDETKQRINLNLVTEAGAVAVEKISRKMDDNVESAKRLRTEMADFHTDIKAYAFEIYGNTVEYINAFRKLWIETKTLAGEIGEEAKILEREQQLKREIAILQEYLDMQERKSSAASAYYRDMVATTGAIDLLAFSEGAGIERTIKALALGAEELGKLREKPALDEKKDLPGKTYLKQQEDNLAARYKIEQDTALKLELLGKTTGEQKLITLKAYHNETIQAYLEAEGTIEGLEKLKVSHTQEVAWAEYEIKKDQYDEELKLYLELQKLIAESDKKAAEDKKRAYEDTWSTIMDFNNKVSGEMGKAGALAFMSMKEINDAIVNDDMSAAQKRIAIASGAAGSLAGIALMISNTSTKHGRAAFTAYKALAVAQAVIDTYAAAQAAYKAMASIPYVGPALGIAAAAAAITAGAARVSQIKAQQPGNASVSGATGGGYAYAQPNIPSIQPTTASQERTVEVTINILGNVIDQDRFARELIPSISKAVSDGVR